MHYLILSAVAVGLVWFAFGEDAARTAVGVALATFAGLFLLFVSVMLYVVHRDNAKYTASQAPQFQAACVKIGDAIAIAGNCR